ncbi:MAG: VOC family protein [Burkholderiales bacterium]|nr:VOC family protein [Burkholderiales bacterium]
MTTPTAIGQIALPVHDVDRATAFYRDVLGLRFLFSAPPGLAFFDCGGVRLMLSRPEGVPAGNGSVLYYRVDNLDASYARLKAAGATEREAPHMVARLPDHELWMAVFEDGECNVLGLMEERR